MNLVSAYNRFFGLYRKVSVMVIGVFGLILFIGLILLGIVASNGLLGVSMMAIVSLALTDAFVKKSMDYINILQSNNLHLSRRIWEYTKLLLMNALQLLSLALGALSIALPFIGAGPDTFYALYATSKILWGVALGLHVAVGVSLAIVALITLTVYILSWYTFFKNIFNGIRGSAIPPEKQLIGKQLSLNNTPTKMLVEKSQKEFLQEQRTNRRLQSAEYKTDGEKIPDDPTHISKLTPDMHRMILGLLGPADLNSATQVCEYWYNQTRYNRLWHSACRNVDKSIGKKINPDENYNEVAFGVKVYIVGPPIQVREDTMFFMLTNYIPPEELQDVKKYFELHSKSTDEMKSVDCFTEKEVAEIRASSNRRALSRAEDPYYECPIFEAVVCKRDYDKGNFKTENPYLGGFSQSKDYKSIPFSAVKRVVSVSLGVLEYKYPEKLPVEEAQVSTQPKTP